MTEISNIKKTINQFRPQLEQYGIEKIGIFGSYSRGEQREDSDVDILINLSKPIKIGYLELIALEDLLSESLSTPVDLVVKSSLKESHQEKILKEVQYL